MIKVGQIRLSNRNATEAMLAVQMIAVNDAALLFLRRATADGQTVEGDRRSPIGDASGRSGKSGSVRGTPTQRARAHLVMCRRTRRVAMSRNVHAVSLPLWSSS